MTNGQINDGYGDRPTVDETLADYDAWLHHRANQMLSPTDPQHDDLVQEGRIAMWQALARYEPGKGALPAWLTRHANWHMKEVVTRGGTWTGKPRAASTSRVEVQVRSVSSLNALLAPEDGRPAWERAGGVTPDFAEVAMEAYHHGEIAQALSELTQAQRRYVAARFWGDARTAELKQLFGYDPGGLWRSPKNGAQRRLARSLAHLNAA